MENGFHESITSEEFRYAVSAYSLAVVGKLAVPEIEGIQDETAIIYLEAGGRIIRVARKTNNPSLRGLFAVANEFKGFGTKAMSVLLHVLIYEKIVTNIKFNKFIKNPMFYNCKMLDLIKDIPIKIGEEECLDDLNMDYIMEKFKSMEHCAHD